MRSSMRWLVAFMLGQIVAIGALIVARSITYTYREVACVIVVCVLTDLAVLTGIRLSTKEAYEESSRR